MKCEACDHENVDGARFCAGCGAILPTQQEAGDDPMIGQIVGGRYRVTRVLGEGGMGIVYEAEQQMGSTVRKVAVKTLHAHLSKDPSVLARFHRECGTVSQLEHPNTIKFYDFGSMSDGTLYIAMEFVSGSPLDRIVEQGPMPPARVLKVMKQICGALDEAHKQGVVHRDLKPENVILTTRAGEQDFVKVLDFGIAARSESADAQKEAKLTQQGMVLGTPPYMSPEQFTGKELDQRSDIYSLGVMAYEMLTGKLPFDADTPWEWATKHMTAQPTPFEASPQSVSAPPNMRQAIMRALSKDREERQPTAVVFYSELSGGGGITVEQAPAGEDLGSSSTAAMAAVPDFGVTGGAAPMAAMGAPMAMGGPPMGGPPMGPMGGPPVMGMPPPPPPRQDPGGGGKGLIFGLAGVLGLLAIAIIAVVVLSGKKDDGPTGIIIEPAEGGITSGGTATEVTPETPPTGDDSGDDNGEAAAGGTSPSPSPSPTPKASPTPGPTPKASPTPSPQTNTAACDQCISAAGNPTAAAGLYRSCTDAAKKAQCQSRVRSSAPGAAKAAAFNGNCGQAKAIHAAATGMGAGSAALNSAISSCN
ncbi:MAG: protein kinase [Polyangiaceae bacterium]|nr:protein kinase [Polyangiaceae bacterium]MCW5792077.1 protein kinase [Polyangiaceae bacterium]